MIDLPRIKEGDITDLVEDTGNLKYLGKCTIRGSFYHDFFIILKNTHVKDRISTSSKTTEMDEESFLNLINDYLTKHKMYMTQAHYNGDGKWFGIMPRKLQGQLYTEIPKE